MRTYISPIGYDTRRVTKPIINTGFGDDDRVVLVRPGTESDTERATQAIADVEQFLHEIEPGFVVDVERVATETFEATVRECCAVLASVANDHETIVALGGGARDVLLPLTVAALVYAREVDTALFFSDLDSSVREWPLPDLTATVPDRTRDTLAAVVQAGDWCTLNQLAAETDQSKSTVIRHVNDLEDRGILEADTRGTAKRVRVTFTGKLLSNDGK